MGRVKDAVQGMFEPGGTKEAREGWEGREEEAGRSQTEGPGPAGLQRERPRTGEAGTGALDLEDKTERKRRGEP